MASSQGAEGRGPRGSAEQEDQASVLRAGGSAGGEGWRGGMLPRPRLSLHKPEPPQPQLGSGSQASLPGLWARKAHPGVGSQSLPPEASPSGFRAGVAALGKLAPP